jgi:hypothetical protein
MRSRPSYVIFIAALLLGWGARVPAQVSWPKSSAAASIQLQAVRAISGAAYRPVVEVRPDWYY